LRFAIKCKFLSCDRSPENWDRARIANFASFRSAIADFNRGMRKSADYASVGVAAASDPRVGPANGASIASRRSREGSTRERKREKARERYVGVREKSRLVRPLSEKPAWLLDRPALRSVLHCAPCEAELLRYLLAFPLTHRDPRGIDPLIGIPCELHPPGNRERTRQPRSCHFWKESGKGRTKGLKEKTTMCERKLLRVF